jgi:hypothetical protein
MENAGQLTKRTVLKLLAAWPWLAACTGNARSASGDRFDRISLILVVDAVPTAELRGVKFYDDLGYEVFSSSLVARRNRAIMGFGSSRMPRMVRVVWREGAGWDDVKKVWNEGQIAGDYIVDVAERIPDAVIANIRTHGGGLRLKFRLKPDGVLFGWDIERSLPIPGCDPKQNATCLATHFFSPGGDFLDTRY